VEAADGVLLVGRVGRGLEHDLEFGVEDVDREELVALHGIAEHDCVVLAHEGTLVAGLVQLFACHHLAVPVAVLQQTLGVLPLHVEVASVFLHRHLQQLAGPLLVAQILVD